MRWRERRSGHRFRFTVHPLTSPSHYPPITARFKFTGSTYLAHSMPYAIIKTGGKQFRVEPGRTYRIPSLAGEAGSDIEFNEVLLGSDGSNVRTGVPALKGARVTGEIVKHGRGEKIIVFKHKRRKNYARKRGHRQGFTEVRITDISLG